MTTSTSEPPHHRTPSIISVSTTADTEYVLARESQDLLQQTRQSTESRASRPDPDETFLQGRSNEDNKATSFSLQHDLEQQHQAGESRRLDTGGSGSSSPTGSTSYNSDPELLEMLENDDIETDFDLTEEELEEGQASDVGDPLVYRGRRRRRKRWVDDEETKEKSLFEVCQGSLGKLHAELTACASSDTSSPFASSPHVGIAAIQLSTRRSSFLYPDHMRLDHPVLLRAYRDSLPSLV
jgi:hypothetical protein